MKLFRRKSKQEPALRCSVIVLAAGDSSRMGQDKILLQVGGIPVIVHTLKAFDPLPEVDEIIVVTREDLIPEVAELCREFDLRKVRKIVRGGATRLESARIGTLEADYDSRLIAVHDAARPFVTQQVIRDAVAKAAETGAAAPAVPVKDTIKVARGGIVEYTPERGDLFAVQTPQVFDADLLRAALQKALDDQAQVTDDCSAVERLGMKVSLTMGDERNIKLTTPADLLLADLLLEEMAK